METNEPAKRDRYQEVEKELMKLVKEIEAIEEGDRKRIRAEDLPRIIRNRKEIAAMSHQSRQGSGESSRQDRRSMWS